MISISQLKLLARHPRRASRSLRLAMCPLDVPEEPHLDPEALVAYAAALEDAEALIEYGAGGSTLFAARRGVSVISAETSRRFADVVNRQLMEIGACDAVVAYCDVGPTEQWGAPVDITPTPKNVAAWRRYVEAPWKIAFARGLSPDLALVDGRFRVACVAYSALEIARTQSNGIILLDDFDREAYKPVEIACRVEKKFGCMARLRVRSDVSAAEIEALLQTHLTDSR